MNFLLIYAMIICFASIVGVATGFGFSVFAIAVLSIMTPLPVADVLFLVGLLHLMLSGYKVLLFKGAWSRLSLYFIVIGSVSSLLGAWLTIYMLQQQWQIFLGLFLCCYASIAWYCQPPIITQNNKTTLFGAALSGFFSGLLGVGGAVRSLFLGMYNLPKEMYIATTGLIACAIDIARLMVYQTNVQDMQYVLWLFLMSLPIQLMGVLIGKKLVTVVPQHYYRHVVSVALGLFGVWLLISNWL